MLSPQQVIVPSVLSPHPYFAVNSESPTLTDKKEPEGMLMYELPLFPVVPPLSPKPPPPPNVPPGWQLKAHVPGLVMEGEPPDAASAPPAPVTLSVTGDPPEEPPTAVEPASRMCDCNGDEEQAKAVSSVSDATFSILCPERFLTKTMCDMSMMEGCGAG